MSKVIQEGEHHQLLIAVFIQAPKQGSGVCTASVRQVKYSLP